MKLNMGNLKGHVKWIVLLVILIAVLGMASFDATYTIKEQEQAVLTTFGVPKAVTNSGLHFKIPLIQQVELVNTTIQGFPIGYRLDGDEDQSSEDESLMITADYNFVNVDFFVEYKVGDPVKAVYASQDPVIILKNIAQSCIRNVIGSYNVDDVLTTEKYKIQGAIKEMILKQLEEHDIGIVLVNITIQDSEPPTKEVMEAFKAVETAKQGKETALNNANKYKNEKLPAAQAQADKILQEAESTKQARINEANGDVARFNAMYAEYVKNPEVTKKRLFYETMEKVLPDLKVVINGANANLNTVLPLEPFAEVSPDTNPTENNVQTPDSNSNNQNPDNAGESKE